MDEISLAQKFVNLFLLMGGIFAVFYTLIYGVFWLGVAVLGMLAKQPMWISWGCLRFFPVTAL